MATRRRRADPPDQEALIERARRGGSSFFVVGSLYDLIENSPDVPLDPRWRELWERNRDEVIRDSEAPEHVIGQIDDAIGAIISVDPAIGEILLQPDRRVCLLLGAGASTPPPSSIPVVAELLPELWRRARKLGREDIDRLASWCDERGVSNIEDLLTAAYIANFAAKSTSISGLLNYFLFRERDLAEGVSRRALRAQRIGGFTGRRRIGSAIPGDTPRPLWPPDWNDDSCPAESRSHSNR